MLIDDPNTPNSTPQDQAEDREERNARATEMLKDDADPAAAKPKEGADAQKPPAPDADAQKPPTDAKPPVDAKPGDNPDEKLTYFNDPRFQEIYKEGQENKGVVQAFHQIFNDGSYSIKDTATLKEVLNDSFLLYDIANGKKDAGELLDLLSKNWKEDQVKGVLQQLADYAAAKGVKAADKPADPNAKTITDFQKRLDARDAADQKKQTEERERQEYDDRMANVITPMEKFITDSLVKKGFDLQKDAEIISDYCINVSAKIGADPKVMDRIVKQIRQGKTGELERVFAEYDNLVVDRAKRYADTRLKSLQTRDKNIPKQAAGGAAPSGAEKKPDLATSEGRTKRAEELWNQPEQQ